MGGGETACVDPTDRVADLNRQLFELGRNPANPISNSKPLRCEIEPVLNGYVVIVGCQRVVFETMEKMLKELERYLKDPQTVEKEYLKK